MTGHVTNEKMAELHRIAEAFAQRTQARDWGRLDEALLDAANGTWSMECDRVVGEIVDSHAMTGTWTPDTAIPYGPLLLDGIYEAITGVPVSEATLAGCRNYFARFPERRVFAESAAEAKKSAEEARRELGDCGQQH